MRDGPFGIRLLQLAGVGEALIGAAVGDGRLAQRVQGSGIARSHRQGAVRELLGLLRLPGEEQLPAQIAEQLGVVGELGEAAPELGDGVVDAAEAHERLGPLEEAGGRLRLGRSPRGRLHQNRLYCLSSCTRSS